MTRLPTFSKALRRWDPPTVGAGGAVIGWAAPGTGEWIPERPGAWVLAAADLPADGGPGWLYAAALALVVAGAVMLAVVGFNMRLQRKVQQATQRLRESEERFRGMFEHAPVAIVEADYTAVEAWVAARRRDGVGDLEAWLDRHPGAVAARLAEVCTVRANRAALDLLAVADEAEFTRCTTAAENTGMHEAFRKVLLVLWRGGLDVQVELNFRKASGRTGEGVLRWSVSEVGGRPDFRRVLMAITELTALREAEGRWRASEERFRRLFESAIEGVYESTPGDGLVAANPAFARMFGHANPEELLARCQAGTTSELYADPGRRQAFLAALGDGESLLDFESEIVCADGGRRWISENVRAVRDTDGRLLRLQGFVSDISERKRFERALGEERERLAVTLRAMNEGVITTDAAGSVQFVNEAAEHLTGWGEGAAIGRPLAEVCCLQHERTRAPVAVRIAAALGGADVVELPRSTLLVHRAGGVRLVEGRCAPIHNPTSRAVGIVLVLRDVTERSRHEAERARTSKLESLGVLAGGIAHDFNNLLTVVLGNLHLAAGAAERALPEAMGWLRDAETAASRAQDLTQQLLTFAKGGDPVRSAVRLPEVLREAAGFALRGSPVRGEFDFADALWPAEVDRGQISQVVQNLVLNAVQAMPDGGVLLMRLRNQHHRGDPARAISAGPYLLMEIEDIGEGIPLENINRIFDPYFTTKETGSGLGLSTVYSIVKRHAGHIEVASESGQGTTFRVLLPAMPEAPVRREEDSRAPVERVSGRVLFMDDEANLRRMADTLLSHIGLEVCTVADGAEAVHRYHEARQQGRPFDVVVMDLTVPGGMGGREALEQLQRIDPAVRAIVSSGYSTDPVLAQHREHGFRGRVSKPYRAADLARVLREVLEDRIPENGADG